MLVRKRRTDGVWQVAVGGTAQQEASSRCWCMVLLEQCALAGIAVAQSCRRIVRNVLCPRKPAAVLLVIQGSPHDRPPPGFGGN